MPNLQLVKQSSKKVSEDLELQIQLNNFNKWLSAKSQHIPHKLANNNAIAWRGQTPNSNQQKLNFKPLSLGFFSPSVKLINPGFQSKDSKKQDKNDSPAVNITCSNCGEADHNSMSCNKLSKKSSKR